MDNRTASELAKCDDTTLYPTPMERDQCSEPKDYKIS